MAAVVTTATHGDPIVDLVESDLVTPIVDVVLWAVTTNCNLRCTYCGVSHPNYRGEDYDLSHAGALAESFKRANVQLVQISGHGETTMIPGWETICTLLDHHGINVCITSNFSKVFSESEINALARMGHITISIDTVDRELLKTLRRKVDLRTILYNMSAVRLEGKRIDRTPTFNWQCTLSDAVITGLSDWLDMGLLNGVSTFTLGNLLEHEGLPQSRRHPAKLDGQGLLSTCDTLDQLSRKATSAGATLVIQPGILEGINESLARFGHNKEFAL